MPTPSRRNHLQWLVGGFLVLPALHPLLIPLVGVPSHLLWWAHVLPVAVFSFQRGRAAAAGLVLVSASLVSLGELSFGSGYMRPADTQTVIALTFAVTATNLLVASFALYARQVSRQYRLLFNEVKAGLVLIDGDGRLRRWNPAAAAMLGLGRDQDARGRPLHELIGAEVLRDLPALARRGGWTGQVELRSSEPSRCLHMFLTAVPDPDSEGYQLFLSDRSMEVAQEQELERQSKLAALGEALAGVAHELNNPLAAIMMNAELGLMGHQDEADPDHELLSAINHQAERMKGLIRELLGFSRVGSDDGCVGLIPIIERVLKIQSITVGRKIAIEADLSWDGRVKGTAAKIEQILLNLLSNAAYAVREGAGSTIRVRVRRTARAVSVEVLDDGEGIHEDVLPTIFEPFVTTKPEGEGTGLGLAISRRLARSWGGDLEARNVDPHGAAFTLTLPLPGGDAATSEDEGLGGSGRAA